MWNFKKRLSSIAVEKHRKRVSLRRKTIFVQGSVEKETSSTEWKLRGVVPFDKLITLKLPDLRRRFRKLTHFYH